MSNDPPKLRDWYVEYSVKGYVETQAVIVQAPDRAQVMTAFNAWWNEHIEPGYLFDRVLNVVEVK